MAQFKGRVTTKKKQSPTMEVHNSLKQEVLLRYLYIRVQGGFNDKILQAGSSFIFA